MANQYTTGQGQGFDPYADPNERTLASGVNNGQGLQNMDPGKMANPYASAARSVASRVQGAPWPTPTGGTQPPSMAQQAPAAPGGQRPPAAAPAAPMAKIMPPPTMPALQVSPTGQYMPPSPGGQFQPSPAGGAGSQLFDPSAFASYGANLLNAANGMTTPAQDIADKQGMAEDYYWKGSDAATQSAGRGLTGQSGSSALMQSSIAGNLARAIADRRAADVIRAREEYGQWLNTGLQQKQFEARQRQEELNRQEAAQEAFNSLVASMQEKQAQRELEKKKLGQQEEQFYGGLLGSGLGAAAGSIFGPAGTALGAGLGRAIKGAVSDIDW